jgi:CTP:molybdopterin cytidylyltransferase MocA
VHGALAGSGVFCEIVVVTGFSAELLKPELKRLKARSVYNPDFALGMHRSIRTGLSGLAPDWDAALIAMVDQPQLGAGDYRLIAEAYQNSSASLVRPWFRGEPGNPCILGRKHLPEILAEPDSDRGCAYLFKRHPDDVLNVEVGTDRYQIDFDVTRPSS